MNIAEDRPKTKKPIPPDFLAYLEQWIIDVTPGAEDNPITMETRNIARAKFDLPPLYACPKCGCGCAHCGG